ncbi:hypothetical protein D9757_006784 [Collybiopsis confluens]|uniref:Uncharacterized protein n=1 Tax=Collybiopsis confluens TaxID=2823264 RepID=A0A8H5HM11_9AGAR|nr:hypothetical protein D9757_006784 [Collybiopsis confluens]
MLKTEQIECWIATCSRSDPRENPEQLQCGPSTTEIDKNGTIIISASIRLPSTGFANDRDYDMYWRTIDPLSLWCTIMSKRPAGRNATLEAKGWMCQSQPETQSCSTLNWREKKLLRPYGITKSCRMGSIRLEIQRINENVNSRWHNGKDEIIMDMLDEDLRRPWLVFEFDFEREQDDTLGCIVFNLGGSTSTASFTSREKRKRRTRLSFVQDSISTFIVRVKRPKVGNSTESPIRVESNSPVLTHLHLPSTFRNATPGPSSSSVAHESSNEPNLSQSAATTLVISTGDSRTDSQSEDKGRGLANHNESSGDHRMSPAEVSRKKLLARLKSQYNNLDEKVKRVKQENAEIAELKKQIKAKEKEYEQANQDIDEESVSAP